MENLKILQVVGYKNSGKTTLISRWTELLSKNNRNVAVIKHHGHGGTLEQPLSETDSMRYMQAGSASSIVFDDQLIQLHMKQQPPSLSTAIEMAKLAGPELILIEGVKAAQYQKIVLLRNIDDWQALKSLKHTLAVIVHEDAACDNAIYMNITDEDSDGANDRSIIWMKRDDREAINRFLLRWMDEANQAENCSDEVIS